jgi:hypothetical protein
VCFAKPKYHHYATSWVTLRCGNFESLPFNQITRAK